VNGIQNIVIVAEASILLFASWYGYTLTTSETIPLMLPGRKAFNHFDLLPGTGTS
jgi:hypothetical protein